MESHYTKLECARCLNADFHWEGNGQQDFKRSHLLSPWHWHFICIYRNTLKATFFCTPSIDLMLRHWPQRKSFPWSCLTEGRPHQTIHLSHFICIFLSQSFLALFFRMNANPWHASIQNHKARTMRLSWRCCKENPWKGVHLVWKGAAMQSRTQLSCSRALRCHFFINLIPPHSAVVQNSGLIPTLISTIWFT